MLENWEVSLRRPFRKVPAHTSILPHSANDELGQETDDPNVSMTTAKATENPQINDMTGYISKNDRAARIFESTFH